MWFLEVVITLSVLLCVDTWTCPNKVSLDCVNNVDCDILLSGSVCLGDLDGINNKTHSFCCEQHGTFCTSTGFKSSYSHSGVWSHKFHDDTTDRSIYYKDPITSSACEFPYFKDPVSNAAMLPIDFAENGTTKLKQCFSNGECKDGNFCEKSSNLLSQTSRFCYKIPVLYDNLLFSTHSTVFGFSKCENNFCNQGFCVNLNDDHSYCFEGNICPHGSSITRSRGKPMHCDTPKDCRTKRKRSYTMECIKSNTDNLAIKGICCVRVNESSYSIFKGLVGEEEEEEEYWYIIVISMIVLIFLVFIGILLYAFKKKIRNCVRKKSPKKPVLKLKKKPVDIIDPAIQKELERQYLDKFCAEFVENCSYTRYEVGMPKILPKGMLDELIIMGYEDFADKYDFSYQQSKKEWDKWTGDLMDNILAQELVAKKEKSAGTIFIPREVEISKEDLERGKKEQPEVSLKDIYFNEKDYSVYRIGSDVDNVELEPSTESISSSTSEDDTDPKKKKGKDSGKKKKEESTSKAIGSSMSKGKAQSANSKKPKIGATVPLNLNKSKKEKSDQVNKARKDDDKSTYTAKEIAQKSGTSNKSKSKKKVDK